MLGAVTINLILAMTTTVVWAQTPTAMVAAEQYRIGPHDVLGIRVTAGRPVPELDGRSRGQRLRPNTLASVNKKS
jgi:hypothetical protein